MIDDQLYGLWFRADSPVLNHDLRQIQGPRQLPELTRFVHRTIVVICLLTVLAWLIGYISAISSCNNQANNGFNYFCSFPNNLASGAAGTVIQIIAFVGLFVGLVIDIYYVNLPIGNILRERASGHLDLLRLTKLAPPHLIASKYMSTQFRAWRVASIEVGLRAAGVTLMVLLMFLSLFQNTNLNSFVELAFIIVPTFGGLAFVYVMEPVWRMRTVVAMGLAVAMQTNDLTSATLMAFGSVFAMRILQIVVATGFVICMYMTLYVRIMIICSLWFVSGILAVVVYYFYRLLRERALNRAMRIAARVE